ncbi:MAG: hypothetical protein ACPHXR_07920 [Flavicella sp.]
MNKKGNIYLLFTIFLGISFHGTLLFFTLETTYDALIHTFFAEHYSNSWFEPWNYKWYTGFTVMSYPPLVHQLMALLSFIGGLKFGLYVVSTLSIVLFVVGCYRFALLLTGNLKIAVYTSIAAVFSSSFAETLHLFGQIPSIIGLSCLLLVLPETYMWVKSGEKKSFISSLLLIAIMVSAHHVTTIFGSIFFIFPVYSLAIMDHLTSKLGAISSIHFKEFLIGLKTLGRKIVVHFLATIFLVVFCIWPYWSNSKKNPITQIPIPHGSRDNFLEELSSGFVFFVIPWSVVILLMPYLFYRFFHRRFFFFGCSFLMLVILGMGGTTPIPKWLLGANAYDILTFDRFTLWASIMALPMVGEWIYNRNKNGLISIPGMLFITLLICASSLTISLNFFKPLQPKKIDTLPIVNFMNKDQHYKWRYMTLGFGDQMAWLSAQTRALSVDGNYHSARRLPELTTRAIERLENSKFKGIEGLGSLQQFLTTPEKYHLKHIFSNDKFYDPILYFTGWERLDRLENGIQVWTKINIKPLPTLLEKEDVPIYQKIWWGTVPIATLFIGILVFLNSRKNKQNDQKERIDKVFESEGYIKVPKTYRLIQYLWGICLFVFTAYWLHFFYENQQKQNSAKKVIEAYYDALDLREFEEAFKLINPSQKISLEQFLLEISTQDGLKNSYSKLDEIKINFTEKSNISATASVTTEWITPLKKITITKNETVILRHGKWYLQPHKINYDIPSNNFSITNSSRFYNYGRKKDIVKQIFNEDSFVYPRIEILSSKLIYKDGEYIIIGELQNIDNIPSDINLKGSLYGRNDKLLASYNAKDVTKHKLLPKEITSFKINFEDIAWSNISDNIPQKYNPNEFTKLKLIEKPLTYDLHVTSSFSGSDLHNNVAIVDKKIKHNELSGTLFNNGYLEITTPQLLLSYYNSNKELEYVESVYLEKGIRQERKTHFSHNLKNKTNSKVIDVSMENCFINGFKNSNLAIQNRNKTQETESLQELTDSPYKYLKIEVNLFIGNPK